MRKPASLHLMMTTIQNGLSDGGKLICKSLWDNVQCEVSVEEKTAIEAEEIVMKWHGKHTQKKMAETCAEIILRVKDSQLAHIYTCNPESLGEFAPGTPHMWFGIAACVVEVVLDFSQGHRSNVSLDWPHEGYGFSAYGNWCCCHQ
jgi:hypothetical protein